LLITWPQKNAKANPRNIHNCSKNFSKLQKALKKNFRNQKNQCYTKEIDFKKMNFVCALILTWQKENDDT